MISKSSKVPFIPERMWKERVVVDYCRRPANGLRAPEVSIQKALTEAPPEEVRRRKRNGSCNKIKN